MIIDHANVLSYPNQSGLFSNGTKVCLQILISSLASLYLTKMGQQWSFFKLFYVEVIVSVMSKYKMTWKDTWRVFCLFFFKDGTEAGERLYMFSSFWKKKKKDLLSTGTLLALENLWEFLPPTPNTNIINYGETMTKTIRAKLDINKTFL